MSFMRSLVLCALLAPACAAAPTTSPILASHAHAEAPAAVEVADDGVYHPPYSEMFRMGETWTMPVVQLAMTTVPGGDAEITCRVERTESLCDRRVSEIKCDGAGGHVLAGTYEATFDGVWKDGFAGATAELDNATMMIPRRSPFERVAKAETKAWGAAFCVNETDSHNTICLQPGRGLIGGRDENIAIGDVPHAD